MPTYIARCNNSCCPEISIEEGQPLVITDDYNGKIALTIGQFEGIRGWFQVYKDNSAESLQSNLRQYIFGDLFAKIYSINGDRLIDVAIGQDSVQKITFDQWQFMIDRVDEHAAIPA